MQITKTKLEMIPETKVQISKEEPTIDAFSRVSKVLVRIILKIFIIFYGHRNFANHDSGVKISM